MPEKIAFLFGTKRYLSNVTPAAPGGSVNVVWTSDGENISASVPVASSGQTPWTQDIDAAGYSLRNAADIVQQGNRSHTWNMEWIGNNWRHVAAGYGSVTSFESASGNLSIHTSLLGAAGAVATTRPAIVIGPSDMVLDPAGNMIISATSRLVMGNAAGERVRLFDAGGINHALGTETSCMYQQVASGSVFRWYCGTAPDSGTSARMELRSDFLEIRNARLKAASGSVHDSYPAASQWAGAVINYNNVSSEGGLIVANTWADNATACFMVGGINGVWPGGFQSFFSVQSAGQIHMPKLPTSATGLSSGALWRDAAAGNVVKIVP